MAQTLAALTFLLILAQSAPKEFQKPRDVWQQPREIQQPKGPWLTPKELQTIDEGCTARLRVAADALFAFDSADLGEQAAAKLGALQAEIETRRGGRVSIEGHTDAMGTPDYNRKLSESRARAVRDHLAKMGWIPAGTPIQGRGESSPVAPNTKPDGSDDPEGRAKNRRVEVVVDSCS